jgi:SAM-dependent methyltransferase
MKVSRDFETIYKTEQDPWKIGDARSDRYNLYFQKIMEGSCLKNSILDIGCGMGSFLARFNGKFDQLTGVEISREAINKGKSKYPSINFQEASAKQLDSTVLHKQRFDTIIFSDVIYYLDESAKNHTLKWIADHLTPNGLAFIAAWCPGGKYLEYDELQRLVHRFFAIESEVLLDSGHGIFMARPKIHFIAVTIDYETWHPIPKNKTIDWEKDIFAPTRRLSEVFSKGKAPITFMVEMGEYFWLKENEPHWVRTMEEQWKQLIKEGHDIQLHLHPNWLPELGARQQNGQWIWDWTKDKAADFPGSLLELIGRCKDTLESLLNPVDPNYQVTSFRAGAYQAQPFKTLHDALSANNIFCDSSVYSGGYSKERGYDYTLAYSNHQPYFANAFDPQLKAPPSEQGIVEIPIFTYSRNQRWFLDSNEGNLFASHLTNYL